MLSHLAWAQTFTEKITRELAFEKLSAANALMVANINGQVEVVGYDGDKVILEVTKYIYAKTDARLEQGKAGIGLGVIDRADTLIVYVREECNQFSKNNGGGKNNSRRHASSGWGYHSIGHGDCNLPYDYKMDFKVKVPASLNVMASTINKGNVAVENVRGVVKARNVNGRIRLVNLQSEADASTVNGDVDVEYAKNPEKACRFYTLNGDINAQFQPGLSANIGFESFNGNFYTNVTSLQNLPLQVVQSNYGEGVRYKIEGNRYQIGRGGALLDFETFNGNVYLKENNN